MKIISIFGTIVGLLDDELNLQNEAGKLIGNISQHITVVDSIREFHDLVSSAKMVIIRIASQRDNGFEIARILQNTYPSISILTWTAPHAVSDVNTDNQNINLSGQTASFAATIIHNDKMMSAPKLWSLNRIHHLLSDPYDHLYKASPYEMLLLSTLAKNQGKVVTRAQIAEVMKENSIAFDSRQLDQRICRLRKRWKQLDANNPLPIRTAHNQGYVFCEEINII